MDLRGIFQKILNFKQTPPPPPPPFPTTIRHERLCTVKPNKLYDYLLNVEPSNLVFLKTCNTEFDEIIVTITDQYGRLLEIEDKINFTLLI